MSKRAAPGEDGLAIDGEQQQPPLKVVKTEEVDARDEEKQSNGRKAVPVKLIKEENLPQIMYKPGELLKHFSRLDMAQAAGQRFEVRIAPQYMSNTNQQVRARQLWGSDIYTEDSDLVAALMHAGYYSIALPSALPSVAEVRAVVELLPALPQYPSASRHSIRSRAWGGSLQGCSFKVDRAWLVTTSNAAVELQAGREGAPPVAPTFSPAGPDRPSTSRAAATVLERRQRTMQEVTVQYNLCNEPWTKYAMHLVADRGLKRSQWTSARLHREALYLETHRHRFEISRLEVAEGSQEKEAYRWARCKAPLPAAALRAEGVPLPKAQLEELRSPLNWEDFQWSTTGVHVREGEGEPKFYALSRIQFIARREPKAAPGPRP